MRSFHDLLPEPDSRFDAAINRMSVRLLEAVEPLAGLLSPAVKPGFHTGLTACSWSALLYVSASIFPVWLLGLFGCVLALASYSCGRTAEASEREAGGTGLDLKQIVRLPRSLQSDLLSFLPFTLFQLDRPSLALLMVGATALMCFNSVLLCFNGGTGLIEKLRDMSHSHRLSMTGT